MIGFLKFEYLDAVFLQQDADDEVDGATSEERQKYVLNALARILRAEITFKDKTEARHFFHTLTQTTKDWNRIHMESDKFKDVQKKIEDMVAEVTRSAFASSNASGASSAEETHAQGISSN